MKEFVVEDLDAFLLRSDSVGTLFKFVEVEEAKTNDNVVYHLKATVWMRTAFLAYEDVATKENIDEKIKKLKQHGFAKATIREAPITLR